jgi:hypothetical protein
MKIRLLSRLDLLGRLDRGTGECRWPDRKTAAISFL